MRQRYHRRKQGHHQWVCISLFYFPPIWISPISVVVPDAEIVMFYNVGFFFFESNDKISVVVTLNFAEQIICDNLAKSRKSFFQIAEPNSKHFYLSLHSTSTPSPYFAARAFSQRTLVFIMSHHPSTQNSFSPSTQIPE
jgi:hypothetical protein